MVRERQTRVDIAEDVGDFPGGGLFGRFVKRLKTSLCSHLQGNIINLLAFTEEEKKLKTEQKGQPSETAVLVINGPIVLIPTSIVAVLGIFQLHFSPFSAQRPRCSF